MTPKILVLVNVTCAQIVAVRVEDWPKDLKHPWKLITANCWKCGKEVFVTEEYLNEVKAVGFKEIKIICPDCAAQQKGPRLRPQIAG